MSEWKESLVLNLLLAAGLFLASLVLGARVSTAASVDVFSELNELIAFVSELGPLGLFLFILLNNAIKTLVVIVFGVFLGLLPLLFISVNGLIIGALVSELKSVVGYGVIAASLAPHGIIEVPILLLTTALGFAAGWESVRWLIRRRSSVRSQLWRGVKVYLKWILPGLVVAAAIEVFITPLIISLAGGK